MIHFELTFVYEIYIKFSLFLFCFWSMAVLLLQHHLLKKKQPYLHWVVFVLLSKFTWPSLYGAIFRFSVLFHWPLCLTPCQYLPLNFYSYIIVFKIWIDWFSHFIILFFKGINYLAPLHFRINFRIILSSFMQKEILAEILIGNASNLYINLGN